MLKSLLVLCILAACWLSSEARDCHCSCSCSCPKQALPSGTVWVDGPSSGQSFCSFRSGEFKTYKFQHNLAAVEWIRVTAAMVKKTISFGVNLAKRNVAGGLVISGRVTSNGCGKPPGGSGAVVYIKGDWKQIIYTQEFTGSASCWKIFGNSEGNFGWGSKPTVDNGLESFSLAKGDAIMSQSKMNSRSADRFDGATKRCDNLRNNFWHGLNGGGSRRATVVLRRKHGARDAGIATETSCGRPRYVIKDIYVSK